MSQRKTQHLRNRLWPSEKLPSGVFCKSRLFRPFEPYQIPMWENTLQKRLILARHKRAGTRPDIPELLRLLD